MSESKHTEAEIISARCAGYGINGESQAVLRLKSSEAVLRLKSLP